jgi:glycosyltransferase involved in cell wall biosynthesis
MDPMNGWVVIAAYKEGRAMRRVVERVQLAGYPVVVVDNGSPDATLEEARAGGAFVLRHDVRLSQDAALQSGIDFARQRGAVHVYTFNLDSENRQGALRESGTERNFAAKLSPLPNSV